MAVKMMLLLTISLATLVMPAFCWPVKDIPVMNQQSTEEDGTNSSPDSPPVKNPSSFYAQRQELAEENMDDVPESPLQQGISQILYGTTQEFAEAQFYLRYEIPVKRLAVGQSIDVVYKNPNSGVVAVNLVTDTGAIAVHVNPRYNWGGNVNFFYLNTFYGGKWQSYKTAPGFPFPANGVSTTVSLRITVKRTGFLISANDIPLINYVYRYSLTPDKIRKIQWTVLDNTATKKAVLESIKLSFP